jgi:hypothetical protein
MPLQTKIYRDLGGPIPGTLASDNPKFYRGGKITKDKTKVGNFVFPAGANDEAYTVRASRQATTDKPVGIVQKWNVYFLEDFNSPGSLEVPAGSSVEVICAGDVWVQSAGTPVRGNSLFAAIADGSITTGIAGATVTGSVETPWIVDDIIKVGTGDSSVTLIRAISSGNVSITIVE